MKKSSYIVFYGSLMKGFSTLKQLGLEETISFLGCVKLVGTLYDLGDYPGYTECGSTAIKAELFKIRDPSCLLLLDEFEGYRAHNASASLYLRRVKEVLFMDKKVESFVYIYNSITEGYRTIDHGDWIRHLAQRK